MTKSTSTILASTLALLTGFLGPDSFAQGNPARGKAANEVAAAANKFLASLDDGQRTKVVFDFNDKAQRQRWSNFPTGIFRRAGLRLGDLTPPQREAAMAVLASALSPQGYEKVWRIVKGDEVLKRAKADGLMFGRDEYYVSFLGQPSAANRG